jgi:hypothetical protein
LPIEIEVALSPEKGVVPVDTLIKTGTEAALVLRIDQTQTTLPTGIVPLVENHQVNTLLGHLAAEIECLQVTTLEILGVAATLRTATKLVPQAIMQENLLRMAGRQPVSRPESDGSVRDLPSVPDMITKTEVHLHTRKEIDPCLENAVGRRTLPTERVVQVVRRRPNVHAILLSPIL